jgi:hypothetical protein
MSYRFFKVQGSSGKYRVAKKPDGTYRCSCLNFIYNRSLAKYTEDKHITAVKDGEANVEEVTNTLMVQLLARLELFVEAVEYNQETYMVDAGGQIVARKTQPIDLEFKDFLSAAQATKTVLSDTDYEYIINEVASAATFWIRYDDKRRAIEAATKPSPAAETGADPRKAYFL